MANRYNQPQQSQFVDTYVGDPLQLIHQALQQKQQQYDAKKYLMQSTLDEVTGLEVTGDAATAYLAGVQDKFGSTVQDLQGKDLLDPMNQQKLDGAINAIAKDGQLKQHLAANKYIKEWRDNKNKMAMEGTLTRANTWAYEKALAQYSATGNIPDTLAQTGIVKATDKFKELTEFYKQLEASGKDTIAYLEGKSVHGSEGIAYKMSQEGIDASAIEATTKEILGVAATSPVGKEILREYEMYRDNGLIAEGVSSLDYLESQMLAVGRQRIHEKKSSNLDSALRSDRKEKSDSGGGMPFASQVHKGLVDGRISKYLEVDEETGGLNFKGDGITTTKISNAGKALWDNIAQPWDVLKPAISKAWESANSEAEEEAVITMAAVKTAAEAQGVTPAELIEMQNLDTSDMYRRLGKDEMKNLNVEILGENKNTIGNLKNYGIFDYETGKVEEAADVLTKSILKQYPELEDEIEDKGIFKVAQEINLGISFTGKAEASHPVSPMMYRLSIGDEAYEVDFTNGKDHRTTEALMRDGYLGVNDLKAHNDARLHHFKYVDRVDTDENGKRVLVVTYLDKNNKRDKKEIPLDK